jgi:hypothetical protein
MDMATMTTQLRKPWRMRVAVATFSGLIAAGAVSVVVVTHHSEQGGTAPSVQTQQAPAVQRGLNGDSSSGYDLRPQQAPTVQRGLNGDSSSGYGVQLPGGGHVGISQGKAVRVE